MSADKFLRGAMILTIAGLLVKILGSVNRILLSRLLGGEGIGLYQMAYPFFLLILSVSSAGIPVAISIIVAEKVAKGQFSAAARIFKISLGLMVITGLFFALLLYCGAGMMVGSGMVRDARAYYALVVLTPAIFFSTILASFRGYFQGHQMMLPPAVSQILEQFVRVVTMVVLAYYLLPYGLEYAAAGAAFGAVPGALTGLVVLSFFYKRLKQRNKQIDFGESEHESIGDIAKKLARLAIPVSCAGLMIPVTSSIDMFMVPNCLYNSGFTIEEATTLFGYLTGMGMPLIMMATIVTQSLAAGIVPAVSEAKALGDDKEILDKARTAMNICCMITMPAAVGLCVMAQPIALTVYGTDKAGDAIMYLAPTACLLGVHQVTTGILQGIGKTLIPMFNMLFSSAVKIVAIFLLTNASLNIIGAAMATNINFALASLINIIFLYKAGIIFDWLTLAKMAVASVLMGAFVKVLYLCLSGIVTAPIAVLLTVLAAIVVYGVLLILCGVLNKEKIKEFSSIKKKVRKV